MIQQDARAINKENLEKHAINVDINNSKLINVLFP